MILPAPRSTYGEFRISGECAPALKARDWKDPMLVIEPLNPMPDGTCRPLKAQYGRNTAANFMRGGGFAATGVIEHVQENDSTDG